MEPPGPHFVTTGEIWCLPSFSHPSYAWIIPGAGASFQHRLGREEDGHNRDIKAVKSSCPSENGGLLLTGVLGRAGSSWEALTPLGALEQDCKATQTQRKTEQH